MLQHAVITDMMVELSVLQHSSPAGGFMASEDALLAERPAARRLVPMPLLE